MEAKKRWAVLVGWLACWRTVWADLHLRKKDMSLMEGRSALPGVRPCPHKLWKVWGKDMGPLSCTLEALLFNLSGRLFRLLGGLAKNKAQKCFKCSQNAPRYQQRLVEPGGRGNDAMLLAWRWWHTGDVTVRAFLESLLA